MLLCHLFALHRALLAHVLLWLLLRSLTLDPLLRLTLRISLCRRLAQRTLHPLMLVCRCLRSRVMRRALVVVLLACLLGGSCTFQALGVRAWTLATKTPLHVRLGLERPVTTALFLLLTAHPLLGSLLLRHLTTTSLLGGSALGSLATFALHLGGLELDLLTQRQLASGLLALRLAPILLAAKTALHALAIVIGTSARTGVSI